MKYFQLFIVSFILMTQFPFSQTKTNKGFVVDFGGGLSFPMTESTFKDNYDYGINISIMGGYKMNNTYLVRSGIHYNRFPYSEIDIKKGNLRAVVLNAELIIGALNVKQKYHPYGVVGTGIYFLTSDLDINNIESIDTENDIGFGLGGGIIIDLSKNIGVFAEVQYNYLFSDWFTKAYMPLKAGLTINP